MSNRGLVAFALGPALFVLASVFDPILLDARPAAPVWIALVGAVAVGAPVVLIAGDGQGQDPPVACAFVAALLSLVDVVASGPPLPGDFGAAYAAFNVLYFSAFTGPLAALGGLVAGAALALTSSLRGR